VPSGRSLAYAAMSLGNADQVRGDEIKDEVGADPKNAAMLGLAHGAMLFAQAEETFDHLASRLRHAVARVPCGAGGEGAAARMTGLGRAVVPRHMRCDVGDAQLSRVSGSGLSELPEPVHESFATDGALARASQAICRRTIRPAHRTP
jgi:hypothetical protein